MAKRKTDKEGVIQLFKQAEKAVAISPRTTVASRKAQLMESLSKDNEQRTRLEEEMRTFMGLITRPLGGEVKLSDEDQYRLMHIALNRRDISEFMSVVWEEIKRVAFEHMDKVLEDEGEEDPAAYNATIEVPELGYALSREGAGHNDPIVDEELLCEILGARAAEVYDEVTIPEHTEQVFNVFKLVGLFQEDPALMKKVEPALISGGLKNPRLNLRNLNP